MELGILGAGAATSPEKATTHAAAITVSLSHAPIPHTLTRKTMLKV